MAQWLQMQLAQQFSIAANIVFSLPAIFIWDMFIRVLPDIPKESAFSKEAMTWKLMWLLPDLLENPLFSPMKRYLSDDGDRRKIHQLAARVADLFDQYLVYRPEWLESWERGQLIEGLDDAQQWQALLWVELTRYTRQWNNRNGTGQTSISVLSTNYSSRTFARKGYRNGYLYVVYRRCHLSIYRPYKH